MNATTRLYAPRPLNDQVPENIMTEVKPVVRQFILTNYLPGERPENLADRTPLQTSGILDSLAVLALASFIEEQFGVELTSFDTTAERFDSIEDIARLVTGKRQAIEA